MIEKIVRKEVELQEGVKLYNVPDARMSDEELWDALHNDWDFANWEEPTAEMCQDMDIEPGIKTLILGGFDEFCFYPEEKVFPDVVEIHICKDVSCVALYHKAFPNVRKITSESPYFLDSDMLVRLPDDIADMVIASVCSRPAAYRKPYLPHIDRQEEYQPSRKHKRKPTTSFTPTRRGDMSANGQGRRNITIPP